MQHFLDPIQSGLSSHHFLNSLPQEFTIILEFFLPKSAIAMAYFNFNQSIHGVADTFFLESHRNAFEDNRPAYPLNFKEFLGHIRS